MTNANRHPLAGRHSVGTQMEDNRLTTGGRPSDNGKMKRNEKHSKWLDEDSDFVLGTDGRQTNEKTNGKPKPSKTKGYAQRHSTSIADPMEVDEDSDFVPGAVPEYELKPRKKTKTKAEASSSKKTLDRKTGKSEPSSSKPNKQKVRPPLPVAPSGPNPLLEYFADVNLDLESASESEGNIDEDEREDGDDFSSRPGSDEDLLKPSPPPRVSKQAKSPKPKPEVTSDSATEDSEIELPPLKRKSTSPPTRPAKRPKVVEPNDDSATEDDGEIILPASQPKASVSKKASPAPLSSDSATEEDDDDFEMYSRCTDAFPKPGFPLKPGQQRLGPLILDKEQNIQVPPAINTYLREYQREGVDFFWRQYKQGRGGLLGDDMGLVSKTIQVISFLSAIMKKTGTVRDKDRRHDHVSGLQDGYAWRKHRRLPPANCKWPTALIIAPSSVVHNWEREFETWGYFEVGMYTGARKDREHVLKDFKMGRLDVVVTSFDLARRDIEYLDTLAWSCVIVDEVHRVKNVYSKITLAFRQFRCQLRFGLTGTTIQNSYQEMWTILDWTNPWKFGTSQQWRGFITKPLTIGQGAGASDEEREKALIVAHVLKNKLLPLFFLRRTKDIIKDQLPKKTDQVVFCPLSRAQIKAYKNILNTGAVQNLIMRDKPCPCGSKKSRKTCCHPFFAGDVFKFMSILIKLSNHLGLILPGSKRDNEDQTDRNRVVARIAFPDGRIPKYGTALLSPQYCGKWDALEILLKDWRKDATNKVLIFTKSVKLLEMLAFHLEHRSYGFLQLDGSTKQELRMPMIDQFHSDPDIFIFLISTLAGGTGLNLTGANKVVIFDPNWNPAHDLQAMDRAFRFGQTRDVTVIRLLGAGSVEELIYARQIYKQQQMAIAYDASIQTRYFEGVQGDSSKQGELFGIENIFKLHEEVLATKMAIEDAHLAELDWALANMSSGEKKKLPKSTTELLEAESKAESKAKEETSLRGLGALLFDDDPPVREKTEQEKIQNALSAIGVQYVHLNDELLVPSKIEEERTKLSIQKRRQRKSKPMEEDKPAGSVWPPRRVHHKPPADPMQLLASRREALIQLGFVKGPTDEDLRKFAEQFVKELPEHRQAILAEVDKCSS